MGTPERILPVRHYDATSSVEATELAQYGRKELYTPTEKIKIIEVPNFPLLGKLTALRFIEWVLKNPGGVALPTGKTPEHFIKWVNRVMERWDSKEIQALLESFGVDRAKRPDMGNTKKGRNHEPSRKHEGWKTRKKEVEETLVQQKAPHRTGLFVEQEGSSRRASPEAPRV